MKERVANRRKAMKQIIEAILRGQQEEYCQLKEKYEEYENKREEIISRVRSEIKKQEIEQLADYTSMKKEALSSLEAEYADIIEKYEEFRDRLDECILMARTFEEFGQMLQDKNVFLQLSEVWKGSDLRVFKRTMELSEAVHESDLFDKFSMDSTSVGDALKIMYELGKVCALYGITVDEIPEVALFDYGFVRSYLDNVTSPKLDRNKPATYSDSVYIEFIDNLGKRDKKIFSSAEIGRLVAGRYTSSVAEKIKSDEKPKKGDEQK